MIREEIDIDEQNSVELYDRRGSKSPGKKGKKKKKQKKSP